ncbi:MAG TPA: DUF72 domain-containing protein [Candidatus Sulfotelmatobacter sp.]|nr:DUF72 domain-containing protein [Candidatus Sulfotelmatobacter sp.]
MDIHIGTSGWSYASWKPAFFPEKLPSKRFLEFYSTRLNAVELNATFRRMPTASAIAGWVNATPPDFRFAGKVHQSITHFKRLKDADESMRFFLQSMEPMRQSGKLGPILVQTPPNLKMDLDLLRTFAQCLPQAYRFVFEFRHESWFCDGVYEILKSKNAALCWAESEKIMAPKVATADFVYYRFREPEYSTPDLQQSAEELKAQRQQHEVYAFFKHEEKPESALNAVTVARLNGIEEKPFVMIAKTGKGRRN